MVTSSKTRTQIRRGLPFSLPPQLQTYHCTSLSTDIHTYTYLYMAWVGAASSASCVLFLTCHDQSIISHASQRPLITHPRIYYVHTTDDTAVFYSSVFFRQRTQRQCRLRIAFTRRCLETKSSDLERRECSDRGGSSNNVVLSSHPPAFTAALVIPPAPCCASHYLTHIHVVPSPYISLAQASSPDIVYKSARLKDF